MAWKLPENHVNRNLFRSSAKPVVDVSASADHPHSGDVSMYMWHCHSRADSIWKGIFLRRVSFEIEGGIHTFLCILSVKTNGIREQKNRNEVLRGQFVPLYVCAKEIIYRNCERGKKGPKLYFYASFCGCAYENFLTSFPLPQSLPAE